MNEKISKAVIRRLPKYYRYLKDLEDRGIEKISSLKMSEDMILNASQIRRDLNCFGGFGQQGYGYSVSKLKCEIAHILGIDKTYNVIVIGAGKIGQALMGYSSFREEGFLLNAIFDSDNAKIDTDILGKRVLGISCLRDYVSNHDVDMAFICTPKAYAQSTADYLVSLGVRAIWNFAPVDVCARRGVSVENVHLSDSLYVLSYMVSNV